MKNILVFDEHTIVRRGLMQIFGESPEPFTVDEAGNWVEALAKVHYNDYDLVLMDISISGGGGLDAMRELKSSRPELPVLVLSTHSEEIYAVRALRAGADGYLNKECAWYELVDAVKELLEKVTGEKRKCNSLQG
jgi:two-component system, NarL family, invasion response regulator UvrY